MKLDYKKTAKALYVVSATFYFVSLFCNIKEQSGIAINFFFAGSLTLCASAVLNKKEKKY